jgi:hypothetical protein
MLGWGNKHLLYAIGVYVIGSTSVSPAFARDLPVTCRTNVYCKGRVALINLHQMYGDFVITDYLIT